MISCKYYTFSKIFYKQADIAIILNNHRNFLNNVSKTLVIMHPVRRRANFHLNNFERGRIIGQLKAAWSKFIFEFEMTGKRSKDIVKVLDLSEKILTVNFS